MDKMNEAIDDFGHTDLIEISDMQNTSEVENLPELVDTHIVLAIDIKLKQFENIDSGESESNENYLTEDP